jgi:hypothetical protein
MAFKDQFKKKTIKQSTQPKEEKIVVDHEYMEKKAKADEDEEEEKENSFWKEAFKQHVDADTYERIQKLDKGIPSTLDDLRKIRQRKNEEAE